MLSQQGLHPLVCRHGRGHPPVCVCVDAGGSARVLRNSALRVSVLTDSVLTDSALSPSLSLSSSIPLKQKGVGRRDSGPSCSRPGRQGPANPQGSPAHLVHLAKHQKSAAHTGLVPETNWSVAAGEKEGARALRRTPSTPRVGIQPYAAYPPLHPVWVSSLTPSLRYCHVGRARPPCLRLGAPARATPGTPPPECPTGTDGGPGWSRAGCAYSVFPQHGAPSASGRLRRK